MTTFLPDNYLGTEYAWAMVIDLPDVSYYLNYPGSKLWPLAKVRVQLRTYTQGNAFAAPTNVLYEELWYHNEAPLGLRRYNQISIAEQSMGALIVCPGKATAGNRYSRALAMVDSILRLVLDVQFRNAETVVVLVPADDYDDVSRALATFNFFAAGPGVSLSPFNIHLRAYPQGLDQFFYSRGPQ